MVVPADVGLNPEDKGLYNQHKGMWIYFV